MLTDTARGNYSNKYKTPDTPDVEVDHAMQVAARDRVRRLSAQTNRRRKALENKKKLEAEREAKRREQVLEDRRQKQQEATNRFQRLNKASNGSRKHGHQGNTGHGGGTPSLDEMLQMVGVPPSLSLKYGQGYPTYQNGSMAKSSPHTVASNINGSGHIHSNLTGGSELKGYTKLGHGGLSFENQGRVDSRASLLEQEIAAQQQQLIEQQQRTLHEFSQAIQNETNGGNGGVTLHRSGSLSSVDSLEEQKSQTDNSQGNGYGRGLHTNQSTLANASNRNHSHVVGDVSNYGLYHDNAVNGGSYDKKTGIVQHVRSDVFSGTDPVHAPAATGPQNSGYSASSYRTATVPGSEGKNASTQAWSHSKCKEPVSQHMSAPTAQRSRPYSAHTSATPVTVAPAVSYGGRTQDLQMHHPLGSDVSMKHELLERHGSQLQFPADEGRIPGTSQKLYVQEKFQDREEDVEEAVYPPKSILKTHKAEIPVKEKKTKGLAAAIMRDSLDIGKMSGIKSPKKSVRWTDVNYSDDESVDTQTTVTTENAAPRKPRLVSKVNARTVLEQKRLGNGTEIVVNTTPPKPRSANMAVSRDRNSMQVKNHQLPSGSKSSQNLNEKQKSSDKAQPIMQNGIRLDKTPTDDEINWLWDKVRTCLHTREDTPDGKSMAQPPSGKPPPGANPQQEQRITANLRVAPPSNKPRFNNRQDTLRRHVSAPRWRTSSDSGAQLQPRSAHVRTSTVSRHIPQQGPEQSHQGPGRSRTIAAEQQGQNVSDSLMAFQHAEHLVQENADDADIVAVIEQQKAHPKICHTEKRVHPSALSIEEAKIMESLDRLNAKLKTVTADMNGSFTPAYPVMHPRPPVYGGSFRGHRPMSSRPGPGGAVGSNVRARAHSADRYNMRTGQHR